MTDFLELDARNLLCPLPVIKTQDFVKSLAPGQRVSILCTDPGALHDIPTWCRINGHQVLSTEEQNKEIAILIEVGS